MRISAGSHYSDIICLDGYESLTLTADTEALVCNIGVSQDGFVWQAFTTVPQALAYRTAWSVPAAVFTYKYLRLQVAAVDYDRAVTATLANLEIGGIPAGSGVGQFVYAAAAGVGLAPVPSGAGLEIPCMRDGTPSLYMSQVAANAVPAVDDDINDGYNVGSLWFDITSGMLFICVDPSAGAAVWRQIPIYLADGSIRLGGATNYVNIAADGTLTLVGDARTFDDVFVDAYNLEPTGLGVSLNAEDGVIEFIHAAQVTDYCSANTQFRHNRALVENVEPHIHFFQAEDAVPNFMMYYRWQKNGDAKATAWTPYKCNTLVHAYTEGTIHQVAEGEGITPPEGTALSDVLQLRICRDHDNASTLFAGEDPYTATVGVLSVDIHYEIDALGSS